MKNYDAIKQNGDVIWNIANLLRGPYRPPQYRRVMIPLTVLRRLDSVLENTKDNVIAMHKKLKAEGKYDAEAIEKIINQKFKLSFHNTSEFTFQKLLGDPDKLAANLRNYMAGFSARARKIIEKFKFEEEIEKLEEANRLFEVIKEVAAVDLHPNVIPNIAMGYLFEDLVRRFNEQANEEAGDHFTPREVIKLMVNVLFTYDDLVYQEGKVIKIYDPTCGTGGMLSESEKLQPPPADGGEGSRIAIVFNGSPLFTGDAGSGESNIRRWIIENDMLEAIIGLPDQLFYNTGIFTYVWIVTNRKRPERRGKVQLINGTDFAWKMKKSLGDKRKRIGDSTDGAPDHIAALTKLYGAFDLKNPRVRMTVGDIQTNIDPKRNQTKSLFVSQIFDNQDFGYLKITVERPLRLNFAVTDERIDRFKKTSTFILLAISRKRKNKAKIEEEILIGEAAQAAILEVLNGMKPAFNAGQLIKDRNAFEKLLADAFKALDISLDSKLKDALLAPGSLGEKDPCAEICRDKKGSPEPDADLRDTENVPFPPGIALPLPLDYEGKKNKGKVDVAPLLALVQDHCEAYLEAEVLPYRPDAWIDHSKIKVGYEIPFNRHFYEYESPRRLDLIEADIAGLEQEIMAMLKGVV